MVKKSGYEMGIGENLGWEMGFILPFRTLLFGSNWRDEQKTLRYINAIPIQSKGI